MFTADALGVSALPFSLMTESYIILSFFRYLYKILKKKEALKSHMLCISLFKYRDPARGLCPLLCPHCKQWTDRMT